MYIYFILIAVALFMVIGIVVLTIFVMKNITPKIKEESSVGSKTEWEHIRDFKDINARKESKVNEFNEEFNDDVATVGLEIYENGNAVGRADPPAEVKADPENSESGKKVKTKSTQEEDFINDFMTMSLEEAQEKDQEDEEDDVTRDMYDDDETRSMEEAVESSVEPAIKVTLKYKDSEGIKIHRMNTTHVKAGRGIGNDLLFRRDSFTSRNHAVFTIKDNELWLKDLGSKNGTFINKNQKVNGEIKIDGNCEITFGDVVVEVIIEK